MLADDAHMEESNDTDMEDCSEGRKNSKSETNEKFEAYSKRLNVILSQPCEDTGSLRRGPPRKLALEQELLLTLTRLRLGLLLEDLAWRFNNSAGTASSIFLTWVKLLSKVIRSCG